MKGMRSCDTTGVAVNNVHSYHLSGHSEVWHKFFIVVSRLCCIDDEVVVGGVLRLDVRVDRFCDQLCFKLCLSKLAPYGLGIDTLCKLLSPEMR